MASPMPPRKMFREGLKIYSLSKAVPKKGWFTIFRLYGPLEPWFDKTWRPGEIQLVK